MTEIEYYNHLLMIRELLIWKKECQDAKEFICKWYMTESWYKIISLIKNIDEEISKIQSKPVKEIINICEKHFEDIKTRKKGYDK